MQSLRLLTENTADRRQSVAFRGQIFRLRCAPLKMTKRGRFAPSSVLCPPSSVLRLPSSVLRPLSFAARTKTLVAGNKNRKGEIFFTALRTATYAATDAYNFVDSLMIRAGPDKYRGAAFSPPAKRRPEIRNRA
jgi:hypothetical protein